MGQKLKYGLLLVVPSLLIVIAAWMTGAWSTYETESVDSRMNPVEEIALETEAGERLSTEIEAQIRSDDTVATNGQDNVEEETSEAGSSDEFPDLTKRAVAFIEELHSRDPHQNSAEREVRLKQFATQGFWDDISLFISNDSDDATLLEHGLSVEAHVEAISIEPLSARRAVVITEIDIVVYSNGDIYTSYQPRHTSVWILEDKEWLVNEASYAN